jgi:hypothetical protein
MAITTRQTALLRPAEKQSRPDPPPDGDVIGVQTTLGEQLLDIAVGK